MTRLNQLLDGTLRYCAQTIVDTIREHKWGRLSQKDANYIAQLEKTVQNLANALYQLEQELKR